MSSCNVKYQLTINQSEVGAGTKKVLVRNGRRLEITIPAGVKTGSLMKLSGALQITDGYDGNILVQIKVKKHRRHGVLAIATIAGLFIIISSIVVTYSVINSGSATRQTLSPSESTPTISLTPTVKPTLIYENGAILVGGDNKPIELSNNPNAADPTYAELIAFIKGDTTDTNAYIEKGPIAYVCSDFAEDVHNNAEAEGIRAAWVGIDLRGSDEGHALNAFETTDRGLVYVDCTKWDTIAYIEIGKEYGSVDIAEADSLSYSFYKKYRQKRQEFETRLELYNRDVERYNQEILGKTYVMGSTEGVRISAWEARLDKEGQALDKLIEELGEYLCEPLGIVEDIYVHW